MSKPVMFVHGLWIHSISWLPWREVLQEKGYETIAAGHSFGGLIAQKLAGDTLAWLDRQGL